MITYNIRFPIKDDPQKNRFLSMTQITKEALASDLLLLLLTEKGERYYEPDYGTNLLKYIFEPNDSITATDIEQEIKRTVKLYIPTLTINKIEFNRFEDENGNGIPENQLNVKIKFTYSENAFSESGELELNF
jgi:phage baseplate assembly protein W